MSPDLERFAKFSREYRPPHREPAPLLSESAGNGIRNQIDFMASHMFFQLKEHEAAQQRTTIMFEQLLRQLEETVVSFQQSFLQRQMPIGNVYARIDADRSVGTLHLLWHSVSFVTRGNIKPMALKRNGRDPMFSGRIVAIMGDYHENVTLMRSQEYADILEDELASLFIPAAPDQPAVMKFTHQSDELFFHQAEATQQFLLKILEALCGGGYLHESME